MSAFERSLRSQGDSPDLGFVVGLHAGFALHRWHGGTGLSTSPVGKPDAPTPSLFVEAEALLDIAQLGTIVHSTCSFRATLNQDGLLDALVNDELSLDEVVVNLIHG